MAAPRPALPRVVELIRVSSAGQAARDTPADQRAALDRLRNARPGHLVARIEQQVSGAAAGADRPDLARLAELAALKAFDEVRVRHLDRLTRHEDPLERAAVLSMVRRAGAVIVDAGGAVLDPATMGGELVWVVSTLASAEERRKILERTMAAKRRLAAEGRLVNSTPPWGRTYDRATGRWGLDAPAAALYRRLFDLVLAGRTTRQIAAELNAEGLTAPRGGPWRGTNISNIIRFEHVVGRVRSHGAVIQVPPIVDEATWEAAKARLRRNDLASGRHDPSPALLRKIAACGACGAPLYTDRQAWRRGDRGRAWTVYYCSARCETSRTHRAELVDEAFRAEVGAWLRRPGALGAAAAAGRPGATEDAGAELAATRRELARLRREELNAARLIARGQVQRSVGEELLAEVARRRAAAERRAEAAQAQLAAAERWSELAGDLEARLARLRGGLDRAGFAEWREVVERLFPRGSVTLSPSGRIRAQGLLSLDGAGEEALKEAARELPAPSPTS